ncbi:MAG: DNA cytosine methyltransferase [Christensenellaceae bacterium]|nr:DNA cytosine methyltransferase [Christensenellaceae bacterium]
MNEIVVDNFAGGGGASTGIEIAIGRSVDIAINHDPAAIAMHRANHPATEHYTEDVWKVDPVEACAGRPVALAWFSPDCKHHSKAKGGKPVSKKIRGLAWVAVKWAKAVHPRVIMLENVEEFQDWGRLDEKNRPDPRYKGETFRRFVGQLEKLGYHVEYRLLRACDYGAPTIRKRFFLIARCDGRRIVWPEPTHAAPDSLEVAVGIKKPWVPVADVLDFSLPCPSIFASSKEIMEQYGIRAVRPLSENTMRRIAKGIMKFVVNNPKPFIVSIAQTGFAGDGRQYSVSEPLRTVVSKAEHCVCVPVLMRNNENAVGSDAREPIGTITTSGHHMLIAPSIIQYHSEQDDGVRGQTVDKPIMTVDASNRYGMVSAFISKFYGGGNTSPASDVGDPLPTVTAIDHNAVCAAYITQFNNHCDGQVVDDPLNTMTAKSNHFGEVRAFLVKYYGSGDNAVSCEKPAPTITVKDRMGLVTVRGLDYKIVDIGLRMLTPRELFDAQGFPSDYIIDVDADGKSYPKSEQVARCGNAVCPPIPTALVRANLPEMCVSAKTA